MGSEQPRKDHMPVTLPIGRAVFLLVSAVCLLLALLKPAVFEWLQGESRLSPKDQARLEQKLKELDDSEQYALIANTDGWYACLHRGRKSFYLKTGEIWKYGVTSKGELGRYSRAFLGQHNVSYIVQFKGNYAECLKQEQIRLYNYRFLPENVARPPANVLTRPPYNPVMR
jgi:hypothetical protein